MRGAIAVIRIPAVVVMGYCVTKVWTKGAMIMNANASSMSAFNIVFTHASSTFSILT